MKKGKGPTILTTKLFDDAIAKMYAKVLEASSKLTNSLVQDEGYSDLNAVENHSEYEQLMAEERELLAQMKIGSKVNPESYGELSEDGDLQMLERELNEKRGYLMKYPNILGNEEDFSDLLEVRTKPSDSDYMSYENGSCEPLSEMSYEDSHSGLYKCEMENCNKYFLSLHSLGLHKMQHGIRRYECHVCNKKFHFNYQLSCHMKKHKNADNKLNKRTIRYPGNKRKKVQKEQVQHSNLGSPGPVLYKCDVKGCKKAYFDISKMVAHRETHVPTNRHTCPHSNCDLTFKTRYSLKIHLKLHSNVKPFVCDWNGCGVGFARKDYLTKHYRGHTGEKPYTCEYCGQAFCRKSTYNSHIKHHDPHAIEKRKKKRYKVHARI